MTKIHFSQQAISDLKKINDYISNSFHNPEVAKKILKGIVQAIKDHSVFPKLAPVYVTDSRKETKYRYLHYQKFTILYTLSTEDSMHILHIVSSSSDYSHILNIHSYENEKID